MSSSKSWGINRHNMRCTGLVSMVLQCKNWCLADS